MINWRTFGIVLAAGLLLVALAIVMSATYPAVGTLFSVAASVGVVLAMALFVVLLARGHR